MLVMLPSRAKDGESVDPLVRNRCLPYMLMLVPFRGDWDVRADIQKKKKKKKYPSNVKRTSKHKKKFGLPGQDQRCAVAFGPGARMFDAPVGGVNADHLTHGRSLEEDKERGGGRDGSSCMVNTLGPGMAVRPQRPLAVRQWK